MLITGFVVEAFVAGLLFSVMGFNCSTFAMDDAVGASKRGDRFACGEACMRDLGGVEEAGVALLGPVEILFADDEDFGVEAVFNNVPTEVCRGVDVASILCGALTDLGEAVLGVSL